MDVSKEVAFFDKFEDEHGEYDVFTERAHRRFLGLFEKLTRPVARERCFDLGCGSGAFTRHLSIFDLDLTGVDISPRSIETAARKSSREHYLVGDVRATGFADGEADIIVYSGVLHHCKEPATRIDILREGRRILRPGGRLFAYDPSIHSPSMWLYRDPRSPFFSSNGKTENEILLNRHVLRAELEEAGFSSIEICGVSGISYKWVDDRFARLILPFYNLYEEAVRWSPFEDRFGTFLVTFAGKSN